MTEPNNAVPPANPATGGGAGAIGYEYQIDVTVWLALELMVRRGWCSSIEVEPASDEDIAAQLQVPNDNVTVELGATASTIDLEIQIKGRSTGHWTTATFCGVVNRTETSTEGKGKHGEKKSAKKKGPSPRPSPLERLAQQSSRQYLFITNADVDSTLRPFVVREVGECSTAQKEPWSTETVVNSDVAKRIAILPQTNSKLLTSLIRDLLGSAGVPTQFRDACRKTLIEEIRSRLLRRTVKTFSNETLRGIILHHGGTPPQDFRVVRPKNFEQMQERLERDRALLIAGPPGTGKTLVSHELARLFQKGDESHEIIQVARGPAEIRQHWKCVGNQFFIVEDPWGGYKPGDQADLWEKELPSLFAELPAHPGKRIIVTSRAGLLPKSGGGDLTYELKKAQVLLRSEDYSKLQRREILHRALAGSQPSQRRWLSRHEERILDVLPEPMALNQLGKRVTGAQNVKELDVEKLIGICAQDALGSQFAEEIKGRGGDSVDAATVLWAWYGMQGGLQEDTLPDLLTILRQGGLNVPPDVRKLLQWTEVSEWWPRQGSGWRVHPTLLEGLDNLAGSEPGATSRLLGALIGGLQKNGRADQALRLRQKLRSRLADLDGELELALAHHALDRFARGNEDEAAHAYYDAELFLHVPHPVAKLLALLKPQRRSRMGARWTPPQVDVDTTTELADSSDAREAALRFIKFVIARDTVEGYRGVELMGFLRNFGWDFCQECLTLAFEQFGGMTLYSCATLVEAGLSQDNPPYETVFDAVLDALAEMEREDSPQSASTRQAGQWEMSPADVEHWGEQRSDEYHRLSSSLEAAMKLCRQREGWRRLAAYPRVQELVNYWAELLEQGAPADEVEKIATICGTEYRETFWKASAKSGRVEMVKIILNDLPIAPHEKAQDCLNTLLQLIEPTDYSLVLVPVLKALQWPRRVQFATSCSRRFRIAPERDWRDDCFTDIEHEAIRCCNAIRLDETLPAPVSSGAVECLENLANFAEGEDSACALTALAKLGMANPTGASRLWGSQRGTDRRDALLAAVSTQLSCVTEWLSAGLNDPEARVRKIALRHLAKGADESLQDELLNLMIDQSALVRKTLAEVIGERKWQQGVAALLHLLGDRSDFTEYNELGSGRRFEVARTAAISLAQLKPLAKTTIDRVFEFLSQRLAKGSYQHDYIVHSLLLEAIAGEGDSRILPHLVSMLGDSWNVAGWRESYFPLRSAAAWALYLHLDKRPVELSLVEPSKTAVAANDFDSDLAGPSLIVLGMLGDRAAGELSELSNLPSFTLERRLVVWLGAPRTAVRERGALRAAISVTHPVSELLPFLEAEEPMTEDFWARFLPQHRGCAQWMQSLKNGDDVEPLLFFILLREVLETTMDELLKTALTPV